MKSHSKLLFMVALAGVAFSPFTGMAPGVTPAAAATRVPVIYSTDLLHPHDDPDDHFDLACLYAMLEADLRAVILDNGQSQARRPGFKPVWQLNYLTGRHVPAATGLCQKLKSPEDPALDQPAESQNGVNLLLQTLRDSAEKVVIIFVGSARDTVAAFNREPELFRTKVRGIYGFIGEANDPAFIEYNVELDPQAFVRLMRPDLPFFWLPCFDGGLWQNHGHASFWKIRHGQVLERAPEPLQRFFLYMLRQATSDPIAYLSQPTSAEDRQWLMDGERNLWCSALLGMTVGRSVQHDGHDIASFTPVEVTVNSRGNPSYGKTPDSRQVMRFEIKDPTHFATAATAATARLLETFPVTRK